MEYFLPFWFLRGSIIGNWVTWKEMEWREMPFLFSWILFLQFFAILGSLVRFLGFSLLEIEFTVFFRVLLEMGMKQDVIVSSFEFCSWSFLEFQDLYWISGAQSSSGEWIYWQIAWMIHVTFSLCAPFMVFLISKMLHSSDWLVNLMNFIFLPLFLHSTLIHFLL